MMVDLWKGHGGWVGGGVVVGVGQGLRLGDVGLGVGGLVGFGVVNGGTTWPLLLFGRTCPL
jgi:hypothetical protein